MKLENQVEVAAPPDALFALLSNVESMASCLPGAAIEGREGDDYVGALKVKVGPIVASYQGTVRFVELDESSRRAVMKARAAEVNGNGDAEARIVAEVLESGAGSVIRMNTDLQVRGRVAQFGRGAMERISQRMFDQFARNLEQLGQGGAPGSNGDPSPDAKAAPRPASTPTAPATPGADAEPEALNALDLLGGDQLGRALRVAAIWLLGALYGYLLGRVRERR